ncbi:MAG: dodecin domain-containing protein [Candidatus Aenigmatarchaeota archaeon]|nr:MAG: dodecin domain-containing protein [Candidatus Aenigmarchaeota archaeon]
MALVKIIELIGTSDKSWEDAVQQGVEKVASEGKITGIDVMGFKAVVEENKIVEYRAHMKVALVKE